MLRPIHVRRRAPSALALAFTFCAMSSPARGDTQLDTITVTATRGDALETVPHQVDVITREDIEASAAQTVGELLSRLPNIHLRSYDGNDRDASIDIRGMGDTAVSNVVVLVDGVRLNEIDMSGPDLTTVPLSQIERIEILRGGGAVRYGDGAVGGVIDIRTRGGRGGAPHGEIVFKKGSDGLGEFQAQAGAGAGPMRIGATYRRFLTDGYRDNGQVDARDYTVDLRASFGALETWVSGASHHDKSGLPGIVSREAFKDGDRGRRSASSPDDFSETDDDRLSAGAAVDFGAGGILEFRVNQRSRRNPYVMGYNPKLSIASQQSEIETDSAGYALFYTLDFDLAGQHHTLRAGHDISDGDYLRAENGRQTVESSKRLEGRVRSRGHYLELKSGLGAGFTLLTGYRKGSFETRERQRAYKNVCDYEYVVVPPGISIPVPINCRDEWQTETLQGGKLVQGGKWNNEAATLGLTWSNPSLTVFASASSHFRNPNIDELMLASGTLRPQRGWTIEHGLRYRPNPKWQVSATVFWMRIEDEIYYGFEPALNNQQVNRNYDDITRRLGGELELRWQAADRVGLRGSFGYVKPSFAASGADIPHVPRRTASAAIDVALPGKLQWTLAGRHVGRRYDGNDLDNTQYPRLSSYTTWDTALHGSFGNMHASLGINNLTNKAYSALGYSGTFYPMPGRTFYASLAMTF
ncbi:MAG: TonB-dependent receptor [Azoarcus sp.]|jgi:iron complex outermembrane receptor protein|nr:TonB-dependent receptor [Azoarcus sp.]